MKQPTKEQILKAAEECPQAKKVLETLYPDLFVESKYLDLSYLKGDEILLGDGHYLAVRNKGEFKNKSFYLSHGLDWEIKEDEVGTFCLIATRKD